MVMMLMNACCNPTIPGRIIFIIIAHTNEVLSLQRCSPNLRSPSKLDWPKCIALDKVYVSDSCNHRISIFTSEGTFVSSFGGEFLSPHGLVITIDFNCSRHVVTTHFIHSLYTLVLILMLHSEVT